MLLTLCTEASKGVQSGGSSLLPPATRGEQGLKRNGVGKGVMFWLAGPPSIPWGLGGGESLKCFQKMRKWSPPLEWLVTPPQNLGPSDPPQGLVHSRGEPAPLTCK